MRIELDDKGYPGQWIEVPDKRGWKTKTEIEQAAMEIERDEEADGGVIFHVNAAKVGMLVLGTIKAWSFQPPPSREYFESDDFDEDLGDTLLEAIDEYYKATARSDEDRKN